MQTPKFTPFQMSEARTPEENERAERYKDVPLVVARTGKPI